MVDIPQPLHHPRTDRYAEAHEAAGVAHALAQDLAEAQRRAAEHQRSREAAYRGARLIRLAETWSARQ